MIKEKGKSVMNNLKWNYYSKRFSHIYVEQQILDHPITIQLLRHFPEAQIIVIKHFKDVFCRKGQNYLSQYKAQSLIIASKQGKLVYSGAKVCQNFGNEHFYYTSCVMNCLYNCEYCYLKGMYPSGNMVIFINIEDILKEVEQILQQHSAYICVSYDTDLIAIDGLTGFVKIWTEFVKTHSNLKIEIRTKCCSKKVIQDIEVVDGVIYAITVSPQYIIERYEHGTASMADRINWAKSMMDKGHLVRLCFDPMIYCNDWKYHYKGMLDTISQNLDMQKLMDVSIGSFRISVDYLKNMRNNDPYSDITQYPYENDKGVYHYKTQVMCEMEQFLAARLTDLVGSNKVFMWNN